MTTPAEWLEAEYDREANDPGRKPRIHERPIFEVLRDHAGIDCTQLGPTCTHDQGTASWPTPFESQDLDAHDAYLGRVA